MIFDLLDKGGFIMYILIFFSFLSVYITIQQILEIKNRNKENSNVIQQTKSQLLTLGKASVARELMYSDSILGKALAYSISEDNFQKDTFQNNLQQKISQIMRNFDKKLQLLSTIASLAPTMGLLGTVLGLIDIFNVISGGNIGDPILLSKGIAQALITTVTGLIIAVPTVFFHYLITNQVDTLEIKIEENVNDVVSFINTTTGVKE